MVTTTIHKAKTHLSKLLAKVQSGEEVIIAKAGTPIAKLIPFTPSKKKRSLGLLKGKITMTEDWDSLETNKEIEELFDTSELFPNNEKTTS